MVQQKAALSSRMQQLEAELRTIGGAYSGAWTCALTDLTTGEHIAIDEDGVMPAASLIKTPILAALYQAAHEGRLALDARTRYEEAHRTLGSGVLQYLSPGLEMTVRDAVMLMMMISDNAASNMVVDLIGIDWINQQARRQGMQRTQLFQRWGDPKAGLDGRKMWVSSARDMTHLLERLARHECVSPDADEDMLRITRRCQSRSELSRFLPWNELNMLGDPRERWVAEKGGSFLNGLRCGGSIFKGPRGMFVMAAFCEGGTGPGDGPNAEGNIILGRLGEAAWRALAD